MLFGLLNLSFWGYVGVTFVLSHLTILSVTLYLHRCQAHRSIDLHPVVSHFFRFWLWLTTGQDTKAWTAIHRKHHARCETDDDPHSPITKGIRTVVWQGAELYRQEAVNQETLDKFGQGTPDDWMERNIYHKHSAKGILLMLILDIVFLGVPGITVWAIQMATIPFFAAGIINGVGHFWGYRNFEVPDASRNIVPWALLLVGEELHNNHHTHGSSAKFSVKWWEVDLGWGYISLLRCFGLAKVKRMAPVLAKTDKAELDNDTLKAVVSGRFQVLSQYTKQVLLPVFNEAVRKAHSSSEGLSVLKKAKRALVRAEYLLEGDETAKQRLARALERCAQLKQVYQFRQQLQQIWSRTSTSQKELLEALQDWCKRAEEAGIESLKEFAMNLQRYSYRKHPSISG